MNKKIRTWAFFATMILFNLAANFAHPVTPTVIKELGLHDYMFGLALAVMMSVNFLVSPFWGKINTYITSRRTLLVCCIGYGAAQLLFCYATTEGGILLARALAGIFVGGCFVSFLTYIVNTSPAEDQAKHLTYNATINSVAGALGYLVGGLLGAVNPRFAFLAQALCLCISGVLFYGICLKDGSQGDKPNLPQLIRDANPLKAFSDSRYFMNTAFVFLFAVNLLINFGNTGFDQAFNYYLKDQLSLSSAYNGVIKGAVGLISFVFNMSLCLWIIRKTDVRISMVVLTAVCALSALITVLPGRIPVFILFSVLVYAGYSVGIPVLQSILVNLAPPSQKNLVVGFFNAIKSLGCMAGSLTAGFLYGMFPKLPFACVCAVYCLSIAAAAGYLCYSRKPVTV